MNVQRIISQTIAGGGTHTVTFRLQKHRPSSHRPYIQVTGLSSLTVVNIKARLSERSKDWADLEMIDGGTYYPTNGKVETDLPFCSEYRITIDNSSGLIPITAIAYIRH